MAGNVQSICEAIGSAGRLGCDFFLLRGGERA